MTTMEEAVPAFSQSKIVEKALSLPLVSDTFYSTLEAVSSMASPLQPLLASISTAVRDSNILTPGEDSLPEVFSAGLDLAAMCVHSVDESLCSGLDQLLVKVPALKSPTLALYSSSREAVVSLASRCMAQLALRAPSSDSRLQTTDVLLKLVPASYSRGTMKKAAIEEATQISTVLNNILALFGEAKAAATEASIAEAKIVAAEVGAAEAAAEVVEAEAAAAELAAAKAVAEAEMWENSWVF